VACVSRTGPAIDSDAAVMATNSRCAGCGVLWITAVLFSHAYAVPLSKRQAWHGTATAASLNTTSARIVPLGTVPKKSNERAEERLPAITLGEANDNGVRVFVDADGRERHFHGVNAVVKGPPWHPTVGGFDFETSLVDADFVLLQAAGVTVIRLGMMWAGAEPERGQYNFTYIETLRGIAQRASMHGIYTLLDMHQDAMSEKFCGEGFPAWAVHRTGQLPFPEPVAPAFTSADPVTGFPSRSDCARKAWSSYYFAEATATAFQALYSNTDGLLDAWGAMWHTVAVAFKGDTHILGIEAINEPFAGDVLHDPFLLRPMLTDRKNLQHVYDRLAEQVWAADPSRLFFFSGVPWANLGSGFEHAPGGASNAFRSVLVYHHYEIPWGPQFTNSSMEHTQLSAADAARLGTGLMLTEMAEHCAASESYDLLTSAADKYQVSWISWAYKSFTKGPPFPSPESQWNEFGARKTGVGGCLFDSNGSVITSNLRAQARPYAQIVAGKLVRLEFEPLGALLTVVLEAPPADTNGTHTTLLFLAQDFYYPGGYQVKVSAVCCSVLQCVAVCCTVLQCVAVTFITRGGIKST